MRRSRASPDYDAERYYPVHTSRYRMDAVVRLVGNTLNFVMEWWVHLDGSLMMASDGVFHEDSGECAAGKTVCYVSLG